ncbi:phospholipid diacylglycerol acyltransferase [Flagelloscypha sp. PMI_526]|nr:phospholipid diacylglycerol acyltransferase [Flagelloscypha sp. PMI_526]
MSRSYEQALSLLLVSKALPSRSIFSTRRFLFPLGICLGILLGFSLIQTTDIQDMQAKIQLLMDQYDIAFPEMPGFDFSVVEQEWRRLRSNIPEVWKLNSDGREFKVGEEAAARGLTAKHPIVLIPGVISTGLESWSTTPEYRPFFREKMWGGFNMVSQVTFNKEKWIQAMMLDPITGLDPPGVKIRAAEGVSAASAFIQGYWVWSKIVENLAAVNYDTNNLYLAPYDWRLAYTNLEERDGYFSKLKMTIEGLKKRQKTKVVVAAHSMGSTLLTYYSLSYSHSMKWVESPAHGGGGPNWVEDHIDTYVSVAGTHLGVAKAMSAFMSGEMSDTVHLNPAGAYVLERFFSRKERRDLFRSWAGSASMWIKGGDAIWGNTSWAPDDRSDATRSHGQLISFRDKSPADESASGTLPTGNMTSMEASNWILSHTPSSFQQMLQSNYSLGFEKNEKALKQNDGDPTKWSNPLEVRLPNAPSLKMICAYGHGKQTERSYWYRQEYSFDGTTPDAPNASCERQMNLTIPLSKSTWIDAEFSDTMNKPNVAYGVAGGEGDGTVNLLSLGAMCVGGWKHPRWNPANISITTVELPHRPDPTLPRGAPLNEIIVKVATGVSHEIQETIFSDIMEYARKIQWD